MNKQSESIPPATHLNTSVAVLDIQHGHVVRAIGGHRAHYQPWQSQLAHSSDPRTVAQAIHDTYGIREFYIADLDALEGGSLQHATIVPLIHAGWSITLDAGPRCSTELHAILDLGVDRAVVSLERLSGPDNLREIIAQSAKSQLAFGLDLRDGKLITNLDQWNIPRNKSDTDPLAPALTIAQAVYDLGLAHLIVLDLSAVGRQSGPRTSALCHALRARFPKITLWTGGGIRDEKDMAELHAAGVDRLMLASWLHANHA